MERRGVALNEGGGTKGGGAGALNRRKNAGKMEERTARKGRTAVRRGRGGRTRVQGALQN